MTDQLYEIVDDFVRKNLIQNDLTNFWAAGEGCSSGMAMNKKISKVIIIKNAAKLLSKKNIFLKPNKTLHFIQAFIKG